MQARMTLLNKRGLTALFAPRRLGVASIGLQHRAMSTEADRTPLLLKHADDMPMLIGKPSTFQDAISEAKKVFYLPQESTVRLVMESDEIEIALTESSWDVLESAMEDKSEDNWIELEVREIKETSELGRKMGLKAIDQAEKDDIKATEATEETQEIKEEQTTTRDVGEEVETRIEAPSIEVSESAAAVELVDATAFDDLTSVGVTISSPCYSVKINDKYNPHTTTIGDIKERFLKKYESHDPRACHAAGLYCSHRLNLVFGGGYGGSPLPDDTLMIDWLRRKNFCSPSDRSYQPKYLRFGYVYIPSEYL